MKFAVMAAFAIALSSVAFAEDKAPATTSTAPAVEKVGNVKCPVSGEDKMGEGATITYKGKEYNLCCPMCKADFNKDPEKYIKKLEENPEKYGIKK